MNKAALNDPNRQKYFNISNAYLESTPSISNLANGVWNRIKGLYYGTKAAYKADSKEMDKYRKEQYERGNIKKAIFGDPYVDYIKESPDLYQPKPLKKFIPLNQQGNKLPTAPKAEDRFKNGKRYTTGDEHVDNQIKYLGKQTRLVVAGQPYMQFVPATISESVSNKGDTTYIEIPEQKRFAIRWLPKERKANSLDKDRTEYEILKRRFNTAWNISK